MKWIRGHLVANHNAAQAKEREQKLPWGKQEVTAQVVGMDNDFLTLKILRSKIAESNVGTELIPHKVGATIKKKRQTLLKGQPERPCCGLKRM